MRETLRHRAAACFALLIVLSFACPSKISASPTERAGFTFAVFGDNQPERTNLGQPEIFKRILADIDAANPDFVISLGDTICGSSDPDQMQAMYQDYSDTISSHLKAKLYQAVGNHDIYGSKANQRFFKSKLGDLYYSFDFQGSHFIVLDSEVVGEEGRITGEQLKWLKADLYKARAARHKFVFAHRPLFPVDGHFGSSLDVNVAERDALHKLFTASGVTGVFAGHEHLFNNEARNGIRYFITGGAGGRLFPSFFGTGDFHHYISVYVNGDKISYTLVKFDSKGTTRQDIP
jgi:3',5'-cyclic AMP phosphodiesterase CpdA